MIGTGSATPTSARARGGSHASCSRAACSNRPGPSTTWPTCATSTPRSLAETVERPSTRTPPVNGVDLPTTAGASPPTTGPSATRTTGCTLASVPIERAAVLRRAGRTGRHRHLRSASSPTSTPGSSGRSDQPIEGLYATGNGTATVMGRHYLGPGGEHRQHHGLRLHPPARRATERSTAGGRARMSQVRRASASSPIGPSRTTPTRTSTGSAPRARYVARDPTTGCT